MKGQKKRRSLRRRVTIVILQMAIIMAAVACALSFKLYASMVNTHYKNMAQNLAKTLTTALNEEEIKEVRDAVLPIYRQACEENGGSIDFADYTDEEWETYLERYASVYELPAYQSLQSILQTYSEDNGTESIYIGYLDKETSCALYLVDGSINGSVNSVGSADKIEDVTLREISKGNYGFPPNITDYPEYGWLCSVGEGIYEADGTVLGTICIDISMDDVKADGYAFLSNLGLVMLVVTLLAVAIMDHMMNRTMVRPINALTKAAASFVRDKQEGKEEGVSEISRLNIHSRDELEQLSDSIKQMETDINTYIRDLTEMTAEKERIDVELSMGTEIQASMVPCIFPAFPERKEFDIYASMTPAKEVGGDLYDFFLVDEDHLGIVIADVSGKGVPAALFMMVAKALIKNSTLNGGNPASIFYNVNNQLCENNETNMFVTAWMGILTISTGRMVCANAGHEFPAICRGDGKYELLNDHHGFVLAGLEESQYEEYVIEMKPGDRIFVYTDGVPEATNAAEEFYGTDRMLDALNAVPGLEPEELLMQIKKDVDAFVGTAPQFDDLTMVALHYKG